MSSSRLKYWVGKAEEEGFKVKFVPSHTLLDYAGMNPRAAKAMGFKMPGGYIYIDKGLSVGEKCETIEHELHEEDLMGKGRKYWSAHEKALRVEGKGG